MTKSEYQQLVEFIAPKFDEMRHRSDEMRHQFDEMRREFVQRFDGIDTRLTKVEIYAEENRHRIEAVAEGVDGLRTEMHSGFSALREEMAAGFELHGNVIRDLSVRVQHLETTRR